MTIATRQPLLLTLGVICALVAWSSFGSSVAAEPAGPLPKATLDLPVGAGAQSVVLAGGCFWCVEAVFEQFVGVTSVVAGYAGGTAETATYERYHESDHAEVVKITYDPERISYGDLLRVLFTAGDPTTKDGQRPDYGRQYRMAIFTADDAQKQVAEAYLAQVTAAKLYDQPLQVTVEPLGRGFFPAEDYHQHYVTQNPSKGYVQQWSLPKIALVRATFPELVKPAQETPPNR